MEVHTENVNLVDTKHEAFKLLAVSPQVEDAIWLPYILSRKNLRYYLFSRIKANMCLSQNISLLHKYKHAITVFWDTLSHIMVYTKGLI